MSIAKAESAVLDSAAQREVNAAKQEKANADAAEMLAKREAQSARRHAGSEAPASRTNSKYEQAERLLAQFGLADVPPQPTTPQKGAEATQQASSGYERIPIERES